MALDRTRPFTRADARAAGLSDAWLRRHCRRLVAGVWIDASVVPTPRLRAQAALVLHPPGAVASHSSAARIRNAPVPRDPDEHVTVAAPSDRRNRRGVRSHVATLAAGDIGVVAGLRVTAPARMFLELASSLSLVDLVVVGDWVVRHQALTPEDLVAYCRSSRERHARKARRAAAYVRAGVDSPMETRLRMLLVLAGLPEPEVNRALRDEFGEVVMRLDLSWPQVKLAVEYDGRHHAEDLRQWERDGQRRELLGDEEWRLITVRSDGIFRTPEETLRRVHRALVQRGWGSVPPLRDDWRPFFAA